MNKNEFYKQLMSEYTFDAEKIRENAKRGKNSRQKLQPMYIGMSAAAAVCVVTVGTIAAVNLGRNDGVSLTDTGLTQLSASDRLSNALAQLEKERGCSESKDYLVTFSSPMTPAQAQEILTREGNIPVKQLYFSDGTKTSSSKEIEKIFKGGSYNITGAAVFCSGSLAAQLQNDPAVFLIEAMEKSDFQNAVPINPEEIQTVEVTLPVPEVTEPVVTPPLPTIPTPDSEPTSEPETSEPKTEESDGTAEPTDETTEQDGTSEETVTTEAATEEDDGLPTEEIIVPPTEEVSTPTEETQPDEPQQPEPVVPSVPTGVTLPASPSAEVRNTYIDAESAFFLSNDVLFVKNDTGIALYLYENGTEKQICSADIENAKIAWASENGRRLIISGTSELGSRNRLLLASADGETIIDLAAEDIVMNGSLTGIGYNADSKLLALCFKEEGMYYICTARLGSDNSLEFLGTPVESSDKLALAACSGDSIYYTETASGISTLYAADATTGNARLVHAFSSAPKLTRNLAFTHAVFTPDENSVIGFTEIFDPGSEKLIPISNEDTITFGANRHSFINGGSCYAVSNGEIIPDGSISSLAAIEYRRSGSELWYAYASGGTVRITESTYSALNKSSLLSFNPITENASTELKQALKGAVGVNNAIALKKCSESGINDGQVLINCISAYYSQNASQKLITRCEISPYSMRYESGGLSPVSFNKSVLVINSQSETKASGMLFIEAGSFGGRTAYRSVSVSFVNENGSWKLDTVL